MSQRYQPGQVPGHITGAAHDTAANRTRAAAAAGPLSPMGSVVPRARAAAAPLTTAGTPAQTPAKTVDRAPAAAPAPSLIKASRSSADRALLERVYYRCHVPIEAACAASSVPPAFLAALTANESAGRPDAARFEPAVYRHLQAVAAGEVRAYAGVRASDLAAEVEDLLHPKADEFHTRYLTPPFAANHAEEIAAAQDDVRRELSTSWGFTQIMGYHVVGRGLAVPALLDPAVHFRVALELLAEFAHDYRLDLASEFEEMFRCWNTGQPYGKTFDPDYVEKGMRRMAAWVNSEIERRLEFLNLESENDPGDRAAIGKTRFRIPDSGFRIIPDSG